MKATKQFKCLGMLALFAILLLVPARQVKAAYAYFSTSTATTVAKGDNLTLNIVAVKYKSDDALKPQFKLQVYHDGELMTFWKPYNTLALTMNFGDYDETTNTATVTQPFKIYTKDLEVGRYLFVLGVTTTSNTKIHNRHYYAVNVTAAGHTSHSWTVQTIKEATCTQSGETVRTCSVCGLSEHISTAALGHDYDDGDVTKKAGADTAGTIVYTCKRCGTELTKTIPATGGPAKGTYLYVKTSKYKVVKRAKEVRYMGETVPQASVTIPSTITKNGIKYKVTSIAKKALDGDSVVQTVKIGNYVKTIYAYAFRDCRKLTTVTFGKRVARFGAAAFSNCIMLNNVTLPSSVIYLGTRSFYNCRSMTALKIETSKLKASSIKKEAFMNTPADITVTVPKAKQELYKSALQAAALSSTAVFKTV